MALWVPSPSGPLGALWGACESLSSAQALAGQGLALEAALCAQQGILLLTQAAPAYRAGLLDRDLATLWDSLARIAPDAPPRLPNPTRN